MSNYVYSSSPQIRSRRTTKWVMADVCIALAPACIAGCILLGWGALLQLALASLAAVASEFVFQLCCKKNFKQILNEFDFSSLVTGLLVGMNMYNNSKWYVPILASVFAIVVVKMLFGGTGKNIVNPAIAGRIFAFISFGAALGGTMYFVNADGTPAKVLGATSHYIQGATPLQALFSSEAVDSTLTNLDLFLGTGVPGCVGETCKLALILGGIYLIVRGVLNFRWPIVYILTTGVVAVLIAWVDNCTAFKLAHDGAISSVMVGEMFNNAIGTFLPSILSGGLILGAIFMATDFVTTPNTKLGNYVYFVALGILTAVLRRAVKGEAVSFAILLMNLLVPLIDKYIVRRPFGYVKPQKTKKEAK